MKKKILIGVGALLLLGINAALSVVGMNMFGKAPSMMKKSMLYSMIMIPNLETLF